MAEHGIGINRNNPLENDAGPIVIIEVDDHTLAQKKFQIPQTLWHHYYADTIKGLADAGAKVIGLDYLLPREQFDYLVPGYSRTWLKALAYAALKNIPVITGYIDVKGDRILPHKNYLQMLGNRGAGLYNLTVDPDDFIRQHRLFFSSSASSQNIPTFGYLIASTYLGKRPNEAIGIETPNSSNLIYIDYQYPHPFKQYSFSTVHEKIRTNDIEFLHQAFHRKIVLIGQTDILSQDRHLTPLHYLSKDENRRTPGIKIIAHIVNTLINERDIRDFEPVHRFILYLLTATPIMLITIYRSKGWILLLCAGMVLVHLSMTTVTMVRYMVIFPLASDF